MIEVERLYEEVGVAKLAAGSAAEEPSHLRFDTSGPPVGLLLKGAERAEVALGVKQGLDLCGPTARISSSSRSSTQT